MKIPNAFHRLRIENDEDYREMQRSSTAFSAKKDFLVAVARGDGVCLSDYDEATQCGRVRAFGVVTGMDAGQGRLLVTWREGDVTLKPNPSGRRFWKDRPYFRFADSVVNRYMLPALFVDHFPEMEGAKDVDRTPPASPAARSEVIAHAAPAPAVPAEGPQLAAAPSPARDESGYVYVIKSPYGFKIGKTRNMKTRTQLFGVKLPFPIEIVHFGWFDDYSAAETAYHRQYANKRLEGEWFSLSPADIDAIGREMRTQ